MEILVAYGGLSEEREVSLRSGERVCESLRKGGHTVSLACVDVLLPDTAFLAKARVADCVFLCLHGGAGEDGRWQAVLEAEDIFHYTGSDAMASALAMNKPRAKACVEKAGIPLARGAVWHKDERMPQMEFPFVIKPCSGGSSVGLCMINSEEDLSKSAPLGDLLCEEYLPGREYSVAIWNGRALPPIEIRPKGGVYDYAHKYEPGASEEICPAPLPTAQLARLQNMALASFSVLGLRDFARIDFKENRRGEPCFLEANTLPGMTQTSLFPLAARVAGVDMETLCADIAQKAAHRKQIQVYDKS